jgi:hypothetical protein
LPLARWLGGAILLAGTLLAVAVSLRGTPWPAALLWLGNGGLAWGLKGMLWPGVHAPRRLRLRGDGSLVLFMPDGRPLSARLRPASLRLGRHWLLVVHADGRCLHLMFGPGNLAPAELAALSRWLLQPPADQPQSGAASAGRYFG